MTTRLQLKAYDDDDNLVFTRDATIQELAKEKEDFDKYYYRLEMLTPYFLPPSWRTDRTRHTIKHFGVTLTSNREMRMTLQNLVEYDLNSYIQKYREKNKGKRVPDPENYLQIILYEINRFTEVMNKINKSTPKDVQNAIKVFKKVDDRVRKIINLNDIKNTSGIYMLVFDAYNACYIGQAKDMKARILKHWSCGNGKKVDMFRALDTTRIFVLPLEGDEYRKKVNSIEYYLIKTIPSYVLVNVAAGGVPAWQEATGQYK